MKKINCFSYICISLYQCQYKYNIYCSKLYHLVLWWLSFKLTCWVGSPFRKDLPFSCKDRREVVFSNSSTFRFCLSMRWDHTFLLQSPASDWASHFTKVGHFSLVHDSLIGQYLFQSSSSCWPTICQNCLWSYALPDPPVSSCCLMGFRFAVHSKVFPCAIWLPLFF